MAHSWRMDMACCAESYFFKNQDRHLPGTYKPWSQHGRVSLNVAPFVAHLCIGRVAVVDRDDLVGCVSIGKINSRSMATHFQNHRSTR